MFKFYILTVLVTTSVCLEVSTSPNPNVIYQVTTINTLIGVSSRGNNVLQHSGFHRPNCGQEYCDYKEIFVFPNNITSLKSLGQPITKIGIIVDKDTASTEADIKVLSGGITNRNVMLEIAVTNATRLQCRVIVFGPPNL